MKSGTAEDECGRETRLRTEHHVTRLLADRRAERLEQRHGFQRGDTQRGLRDGGWLHRLTGRGDRGRRCRRRSIERQSPGRERRGEVDAAGHSFGIEPRLFGVLVAVRRLATVERHAELRERADQRLHVDDRNAARARRGDDELVRRLEFRRHRRRRAELRTEEQRAHDLADVAVGGEITRGHAIEREPAAAYRATKYCASSKLMCRAVAGCIASTSSAYSPSCSPPGAIW